MKGRSKERIETLPTSVLDGHNPHHGPGSSLYDTAWVASVTKTVTENPQYLFSSAFRAVLNTQLPDGSWYAHGSQ